MTIRIQHPGAPGMGQWLNGTTVTVDDRRGRRLVSLGYAVEVTEAPAKKRKESHDGGTVTRPRV